MSPRVRLIGPAERHRVMASIKRADTRPELAVRKALWSLGYRYRLHVNDLAGRPDIVMRSRRLVIFVHGCLWHLHDRCALVRVPRSRPHYWPAKLARNKARDARNIAELERDGWRVVVIWECETRNPDLLAGRLRDAVRA